MAEPSNSPSSATQNDAGGNSTRGSASPEIDSKQKPGSTEPAPFPTTFAVAAKTAVACIDPGARQTITITTRPKTPVAYHAKYSDGKDALDPGYYGGNNGGNTDATGEWTDSWVVGRDAPPGRVRVDVVAQGTDGRGYTLIFFDVADASGRCES
jgi:hypothetical protein